MRENKAKVKRIVAKATKPIEIGQKITFGNLGGLQNPQDPPPLATGLGLVAYGNLIGSMNKI